MTLYIRYGVSLSENQKSELAKALMDKYAILIRLSFSELSSPDELFRMKTQIRKTQKAKSLE